MTKPRRFALASEWDRLTPEQLAQVTDWIADDGEWSDQQIADYINRVLGMEELGDVEFYQ
jgi:hypothetical protein